MVCATQDNEFAVISQRLGTKALLLRNGRILRELNRSYYHAGVYEYPVCIWKTSEGRSLIAHCPDEYCRIDIEDAETGARLTGGVRKPQDFFHSRLMVNESGTRLLSAGWVWHPWNGVQYFEIAEALRNPAHLDSGSNGSPYSLSLDFAEESSACWQTNDRALVGSSGEPEDSEEAKRAPGPRLRPMGIGVCDVSSQSYIRSVVIGEPVGKIMPLGNDHAICFYDHPKVVSLESGEIIARWRDLKSGTQLSSIEMNNSPIPPLAIDVEGKRFAIGGPDAITVIQIEL